MHEKVKAEDALPQKKSSNHFSKTRGESGRESVRFQENVSARKTGVHSQDYNRATGAEKTTLLT